MFLNKPPVLSIPDQVLEQNKTLSIALIDHVQDEEAESVEFFLITGPGTITEGTYILAWQAQLPKKVDITIRAVDSKKKAYTDDFTVSTY